MKDLLSKHQNEIVQALHVRAYYSAAELQEALDRFKERGFVAQAISYNAFVARMVELGMVDYSLMMGDRMVSRYTFAEKFDPIAFALSLHRHNFLSMSTALNIRGMSDFRNDFIFVSHEQPKKHIVAEPLTQEAIDAAFAKPYRRTKEVGEIEGYKIVQLAPKHTDRYAVETYQGLPVSSPERALVEMIVNVQYFRSSEAMIEALSAIQWNLQEILALLNRFDYIYPYHQLVGFYLERMGYTRHELEPFARQIGAFDFYTQKMKSRYDYDPFWKVYY